MLEEKVMSIFFQSLYPGIKKWVFLAGLLFAQAVLAQPPYIDNNLIIIPSVTVGNKIIRAELAIDPTTDPVSLSLDYFEFNENPILNGASFFKGTTLTIPKIRFEGKNYEYKMKLTSLEPISFDLISIKEISENFPVVDLVTYSPEACQADIQLFGEETFTVADHPEGYKGKIFGSRQVDVETSSFSKSALVDFITDEILVIADQQPPGFPEGATFRLPVNEFTIAPDQGDKNDPDYPVAFKSLIRVDALNSHLGIYRSDGAGGLSFVLATDDTVQFSGVGGVVDAIYDIRLGPNDSLYFILQFENNEKEYLVRQDNAGSGLTLILAEGGLLNSIDDETVRRVGKIGTVTPNSVYQAIVDVEVVDENGNVEGFAQLVLDSFTGSIGCSATDSAINCGGPRLSLDESLISFSSDGATIGAIVQSPGNLELDYKVIALPREESIQPNVDFQGFSFHGFKRPRVCESKNALYFGGQFSDTMVGVYDELMRMDENGNLMKLTDFHSLLLDSSLDGEVPDEIRNWAIGYNCDAALYTWGPSGPDTFQGYEGHWATYVTGQTMEIMDETSSRPNGNGNITDVSGSTSGIDSSTDEDTIVSTGPGGEFYFVPRIRNSDGLFTSTYAVATKPESCL
jgi:hypothetical protein